MGFLNIVLAITDPGDEVILLLPYFFNQEMAVRIAGCAASTGRHRFELPTCFESAGTGDHVEDARHCYRVAQQSNRCGIR